MNTKKIDSQKSEFIRIFLYLLIPVKIISKVLNISEFSIKKYSKPTKREIEESGPKPTRAKLHLELFKLYAWSVVDATEISMQFGVTLKEIEVMQKAIFDHLKLPRFIIYCSSILDTVSVYQEIQFQEGISEGEQKLIENIVGSYAHGYEKEQNPGKKLFLDCVIKIHQKQEVFMPNEEEFRRPDTAFKKVMQAFLKEHRSKVGLYISKEFADLVKSFCLSLYEKNQAGLYLIFKISEFKEVFNSKSERFSKESLRQLGWKGLDKVRSNIREWSRKFSDRFTDFNWNDSVTHIISLCKLDDNSKETIKELTEKLAVSNVAGGRLAQYIALNSSSDITNDVITSCITHFDPEAIKLIKDLKKVPDLNEQLISIEDKKMNFYLMPLIDMDLSVRVFNCLKAAGLDYGWQIASFHFSDFMKFRNLGKKGSAEIRDYLHSKGVSENTVFDEPFRQYLIGKTIKKN